MSQKAIIYFRTASVHRDSTGNNKQERRCLSYAESYGYEVERAFHDQACSGQELTRPGLSSLLQHVKANSHFRFTVIVDDPCLISRNLSDSSAFRNQLAAQGATLECVSSAELAATETEYVESLLTAHAEMLDKSEAREDA